MRRGAVPSLGVGRVQRVLALRSFPAYAELDPEEVAAAAHRMRERRYEAGETILREGRPVREVHFVLRGEVSIRRGGRELQRLGDHSVVGGLAVLAADPEGYEVVATAPSRTLAQDADEAWDMIEEHFVLGQRLMQGLAEQGLKLQRGLPGGFGYGPPATPTGAPRENLDLVERVASLRSALTFAGSQLEALADLAREVEVVRFAPGDVLWRAGDLGADFVVIDHGVVRCQADDGAFALGSGDVVGALDCFAAQPRWYDAIADTEVLGLRLRRETLLDVFEDHASLMRAAIQSMASNLLALMSRSQEQEPQL